MTNFLIGRAYRDYLSAMGFCVELVSARAGLELLEPYRVKRAIILAAGFSERLAPVSLVAMVVFAVVDVRDVWKLTVRLPV